MCEFGHVCVRVYALVGIKCTSGCIRSRLYSYKVFWIAHKQTHTDTLCFNVSCLSVVGYDGGWLDVPILLNTHVYKPKALYECYIDSLLCVRWIMWLKLSNGSTLDIRISVVGKFMPVDVCASVHVFTGRCTYGAVWCLWPALRIAHETVCTVSVGCNISSMSWEIFSTTSAWNRKQSLAFSDLFV